MTASPAQRQAQHRQINRRPKACPVADDCGSGNDRHLSASNSSACHRRSVTVGHSEVADWAHNRKRARSECKSAWPNPRISLGGMT